MKKNIRKAIILCCWLLIGAGLIVLLVAAVNVRKQETCKGYDIDINGNAEAHWFVDKNDIVNVITNNRSFKIEDRKIASFDLHSLEKRLEKEVWIRDAQLFFDNNGILRIKVKEREPITRVFTVTGESFYLDSAGHRLPLSGKMSARLPVFTGYPKQAGAKLRRQVRELSMFLLADTSLMEKFAQIDITPAREFELIPKHGNYIIEFGDGTHIEEKFRRLRVFEQQVLSKTGTGRYERVKLQFNKQVIGVKKKNNNN